jgi:hypothetical protein
MPHRPSQPALAQKAAALLEDLAAFETAVKATLVFASATVSPNSPRPPSDAPSASPTLPALFPCPVDPHHRVPASALASHSASCQAAKQGLLLEHLRCPEAASAFLYADAPSVVQLRRLPIDQQPAITPYTKLPQVNVVAPTNQQPALTQASQPHLESTKHSQPSLEVRQAHPDSGVPGTDGQQSALQAALRRWIEGSASVAQRWAAEQEVRSWRELPSLLVLEAGRLVAALPTAALAPLIQEGGAEAGVGFTSVEAEALALLMTWQAEGAAGGDDTPDKVWVAWHDVAPLSRTQRVQNVIDCATGGVSRGHLIAPCGPSAGFAPSLLPPPQPVSSLQSPCRCLFIVRGSKSPSDERRLETRTFGHRTSFTYEGRVE